jgi:hypothetical protein
MTAWTSDELFVRSYKGPAAAWYRAARRSHEGHIRAGGVERDVALVDADHEGDDLLDAAYRAKYRRYGARFVDPVVGPVARAATPKLVPRATA